MPRYSAVTFNVQPVREGNLVHGYVVSGYVTKDQLAALRDLVDSEEYERSKKWRGQYQELAKAMTSAIDTGLQASPTS